MIGFSESIILPVSPSEAFAYLGDPRTASIVDPAVISYSSDKDPMGVGAHNKVRARMFGVVMSMEASSTWIPGELMVIESTRLRPGRREESGDDQFRATQPAPSTPGAWSSCQRSPEEASRPGSSPGGSGVPCDDSRNAFGHS